MGVGKSIEDFEWPGVDAVLAIKQVVAALINYGVVIYFIYLHQIVK